MRQARNGFEYIRGRTAGANDCSPLRMSYRDVPGCRLRRFTWGPRWQPKRFWAGTSAYPLYGFTQVAIDSEVLAAYPFRRDLAFHKVLHTFAGATAVAALTLLLLRPALGRGWAGGTGRLTLSPVASGTWSRNRRRWRWFCRRSAARGVTYCWMRPPIPTWNRWRESWRGNVAERNNLASQRKVMGWCAGLAVIGGAELLARSHLKGSRTAGKGPYRRGAARSSRCGERSAIEIGGAADGGRVE